MKVILLSTALHMLEEVARHSSLKSHGVAGIPDRTWRKARSGGCISAQTVARLLIAARQIDPSITGISYNDDRIEVASDAVSSLSNRVTDLEGQVRKLTARVAAHDSALFRRIVGEARLSQFRRNDDRV